MANQHFSQGYMARCQTMFNPGRPYVYATPVGIWPEMHQKQHESEANHKRTCPDIVISHPVSKGENIYGKQNYQPPG